MSFKTILIALVTVAIFFSLSDSAYSQKTVKKYNQAVTGNPIALAFGLFNATYEQQISKDNSFTVFGSYWSFGDWKAYGFGGSYRWYIMQDDKKALEGFSFGPAVAIGFWDFSNSFNDYLGTYSGGTSIGIGAEGAYKWVFEGGFTVEPIAQFTINLTEVNGLAYRSFAVGCNLGYAW